MTQEDLNITGRRSESLGIVLLGWILAILGIVFFFANPSGQSFLLIPIMGVIGGVFIWYGGELWKKAQHVEWTKQALREYNTVHNKWTLEAMKEYNEESKPRGLNVEEKSLVYKTDDKNNNVKSQEKNYVDLLEKLDERLIEGKISEELYNELKKNYQSKQSEIKLSQTAEKKGEIYNDRLHRIAKDMDEGNLEQATRIARNILSALKGDIFFYSKHFDYDGFDYFRNIDKNNVKNIKILTCKSEINNKLINNYQKFRDEMNIYSISTYLKVINEKDINELMYNYLIDDSSVYYTVSGNKKIKETLKNLIKGKDRVETLNYISWYWKIGDELKNNMSSH